ncbi:MAG: DUF3108 domain-containing protein [Deltaproteobacteria bacterium]
MLRLAALSAALIGTIGGACGSAPGTPPSTPAKPAVSNDRFAVGPPLVTPGEHMSYRLQLQGMELATYDFAVGEVAPVGGKQAIVVQGHAKTVGLVTMVVKVDDFFNSWVDVQTGRPLRWSADEYATKGSDKERTDARFFERTGNSVPVDFHLNDQPPTPEPQTVSMVDTWDYNSFLVALRTWDAPVGSTITAEVMRSRFMWHVEMKVHGKTKLVTALGELPAVQLDGHTYKVDRHDVKIADSEARDFSVWISDDDGRVPLQTVSKTDYGDIKLEITDYAPGTGKRLRD